METKSAPEQDETLFLETDIDEEDASIHRGRPMEFTPELGDRICAALACGSSLNKVCQKPWAPHPKTIFRWFRKFPAFLKSYEVATELRAEYFVDEMIDIADDVSGDYGFKESTDKDGKGAKPVLLPDNVNRARLRIQTRQWNAERMKPKKYGAFQRQEISGKDGGPIGMSLKEVPDNQLQKRIEELSAKLGINSLKETP